MRRLPASWLPALLIASACGGGCSCGADDTREVLTVYAASSLTDAFAELAHGFEAANPEVDVAFSFAGSQVLRLQIDQGAHADVFASANASHMDALVSAGAVADSRVFTRNDLVVVVPADNPLGIEVLADLPRAKRLVIGAPTVPVGIYARQMLRNAANRLGASFLDDTLRNIASEESNVRLLRAKVELGEADAAIIYRTDALPSPRLRTIEIPAHANVRASYYIATVSRSPRVDLARAWIAYVLSDHGREVLARHGFSDGP